MSSKIGSGLKVFKCLGFTIFTGLSQSGADSCWTAYSARPLRWLRLEMTSAGKCTGYPAVLMKFMGVIMRIIRLNPFALGGRLWFSWHSCVLARVGMVLRRSASTMKNKIKERKIHHRLRQLHSCTEILLKTLFLQTSTKSFPQKSWLSMA